MPSFTLTLAHLKRGEFYVASVSFFYALWGYAEMTREVNKEEARNGCVVLVNSKSGGQEGHRVATAFKASGVRVFDLADHGPAHWLEKIKDEENVRVLVAGGDGTVRWVCDCLYDLEMSDVAVAVLPLGTGNDFARVTGWGKGSSHQATTVRGAERVVASVLAAEPRAFDRWDLALGGGGEDPDHESMVNYFSVGVDARIAHTFHTTREKRRFLFRSRVGNQFMYFLFGLRHSLHCGENVHTMVDLKVDGKEVAIPRKAEALIVLNVNSYGAGIRMWRRPKKNSPFGPSDVSDGLLEVVAVRSSLHMGALKVRMASAYHVAQGQSIQITPKEGLDRKLYFQVDGEPRATDPLGVTIEHKNSVSVLFKSKRK